MSGYRLSAQAAANEARWDAGRSAVAVKGVDSVTWPRASMHDRDNFTTNQVTVAEFMDRAVQANPLGLSATFACVNLIAGTIASLNPSVYRTDADGIKREDREHPLFFLLRMDPNYDQTGYEFWEYSGAALELQGNAYAEIERRAGGGIVSLTPVRPDLVSVKRGDRGSREYSWTDEGNRKVRSQGDMLHIRGFGGNGLRGASTLSVCGGPFAAALETDNSARKVFANGATPSGTLSMEGRLDGPQRAELEALLQEKYVGAMNSGRPMVLDNGLKWDALTIDPVDAQMLESRKFSGEEICRIFGVPPAMVGYGDKASNWGTGKEVDVLGFIKFTLRKRLRRIEQALMKQLLTRAERQGGVSIEFNLEGLLRGDSAGRAAFYQIMVRLGVLTRNEARRYENLPPIEGGDVAMVQMQDVPLEAAIEGENT